MFGGQSLQIARVFGIRIGINPSWFIALFLFIWWLSDYYREVLPFSGGALPFGLALASTLLFFLSIILHELGHAVVALRNKIGISGIDLWLFGGVARMKSDTQSAGVEFRVAAAGPAVTAAITVACAVAGVAIWGAEPFKEALLFGRGVAGNAGLALVAYFTTMNLLVLVFNLVPAFPLDGGRIARSLAWWKTGDKSKATNIAAQLGRGFSWILVGFGVYELIRLNLLGGAWFIFLGIMLGQAAQGARLQGSVTARIEGVKVGDVMDRDPVAIPESMDLETAEHEFLLRFRHAWYPVIDSAGRYAGVLYTKAAEDVDSAHRRGMSVGRVVDRSPASQLSVDEDEPLESLLGRDDLRRLGALMVVDRAGMLRGTVTVEDLRSAFKARGVEPESG